jgi:sulfotransferase
VDVSMRCSSLRVGYRLADMEIVVSGSKPELAIRENTGIGRFAFMSGLPRSGSTLLASILNQNPSIHSGPNSPICGMMWHLEQSIIASEQFNAYPKMNVLPGVVRGVLESFYADRNEPLVIDKSREWAMPQHFDLLKRNLPYEPKIIVCVRPIIEILASFINLINNNAGNVSFIDKEIEAHKQVHFYQHPHETRCDSLMRPGGPIDNALYGVAFASQPENAEYFHIVEYSDLVSDPQKVMKNIYGFLGVEPFEHDYTNIENTFHERDETYGLYGMHDVRRRLSRSTVNIAEVLPPRVISKYSHMEMWRNGDVIS